MARQSSGQTQIYSMQGWNGGLNLSTPIHRLQPNELSDMDKMEILIDGSLGSIKGGTWATEISDATLSTVVVVKKEIVFSDTAANGDSIMKLDIENVGRVYYDNVSFGGTHTEVTGTSPAAWTNWLNFIIYSKTGVFYIIMGDGASNLNYAAFGATRTAATGAPLGNLFAIKDDKLWVANTYTQGRRIYFSSPGIWTTLPAFEFPSENFIDVPDGNVVRDIVTFNEVLYIFTYKDIWALYGSNINDYQLRKVVSGIGLLARNGYTKSIEIAENGIFFIGKKDVYFFDGNNVKGILLNKEMDNMENWGILTLNYISVLKKLFFCFQHVSTAAYNQVIIYNVERNSFELIKGALSGTDYVTNVNWDTRLGALVFTTSDYDDEIKSYVTYPTSPKTYVATVGTPYFTTAPINFGTQNPKLLRALKFTGFWYNKSTSDLTITVYLDNEDTSYTVPAANITINGAGTTDFDSLHEIYIGLPAGLIARNFRVKMQYTTYPWRVKPFDWHYQVLPDRKIDW